MNVRLLRTICIGILALGVSAVYADVTVYVDPTIGEAFQEAQENAFLTATGPLSMVNFDEFAMPYAFNGDEYIDQGITFSQPNGLQLSAGIGSGATARSAPNVLGPPGGPNLGDGWIAFDLLTPQAAVGFWLIDNDWNAPDFDEVIDFFNADNDLIASVPMPAFGADGSTADTNFFIGLVSPDNLIANVIVRDGVYENGPPQEETIGLDNVYFGVPEPTSLALLAVAGLLLRRR